KKENGILLLSDLPKGASELLRVCPDEWHEFGRTPSDYQQYFVIKGQAQDTRYYDINWVKTHCNVMKPSTP
ncbi:MAG: hypothetical protein Q8N81_01020, partial [bacterium]|nr:hypothetical protein [bacterium]